MINPRKVRDISKLLESLNTPPESVDLIFMRGNFAQVIDDSIICYYHGDLVITRNSRDASHYVVKNKGKLPNFSSQFFTTSEWKYVPEENYVSATIDLGKELIAEARFSFYDK